MRAAGLLALGLAACSAAPSPPAPAAPAGEERPRPPAVPLRQRAVAPAVETRVLRLLAALREGAEAGHEERPAQALAEYGPLAAPALARAVSGAPPRVAVVLLDLLARTGEGDAGAEAVPLLPHEDWRVREAAARLLERSPDPGALTGLALLSRDTVGRVRIAAVRALGRLGGPEAAGPLADLASGPPGETRDAALEALGMTPGVAAARALAALTASPEPDVASRAVRSLARGAPEWGDEPAAALRDVLRRSAEPELARAALLGLARMGAARGPEAAEVARAAARAVAEGRAPPKPSAELFAALGPLGLEAIRTALEEVSGPNPRGSAARLAALLEEIPGADVGAVLREFAERPGPHAEIVRALGDRREAGTVPLLARLAAGGGDAAVPAVRALGRIGGDAAAGALAERLARDPNP
ncbi:MAG: HEAT repeat domain-containing protein, partial [Planctomycetales bacterium]|nr:HEAT repeat domain-containing protein [Planctomycetales bacterium]